MCDRFARRTIWPGQQKVSSSEPQAPFGLDVSFSTKAQMLMAHANCGKNNGRICDVEKDLSVTPSC